MHFCQQDFFRGQIETVLAGNDLLLVFRQAEFDDGIVFIGAQQDADSRIFMRLLFHAVIIIHIHLQLADILMRQFVRLDFDNNEALQQAVIENKIGKEVITIEMQALLSRDKGKTVTESSRKSCK